MPRGTYTATITASERRPSATRKKLDAVDAFPLVPAESTATSPISVYSFPDGGNKLFHLSLLQFHEKSQVKIGAEQFPDDFEKFFLGDVLVGRGVHGLYSIRGEGQNTKLFSVVQACSFLILCSRSVPVKRALIRFHHVS
jgi:hypothetical protein